MNNIIKDNKGLVISIAKRYQGKGLDFDDLVQEGYIGLIKAKDKYDDTKGVKFSTYATYWIKQSIIRAIENTGSLVRIPSYKNVLETPNHIELSTETEDNIEDTMIINQLLKKIREILIDDIDYCLFIDHYVLNKSYREISEDNGLLSYGTIKQKIKNITNILKNRLQ